MEDLQAGSEAISSILTRANQAVDEESLRAAVEDLQGRVEDWKNHSIERFGKLLVYGTHTVLKGDAREVEREVRTAPDTLFPSTIYCSCVRSRFMFNSVILLDMFCTIIRVLRRNGVMICSGTCWSTPTGPFTALPLYYSGPRRSLSSNLLQQGVQRAL